MKNTNKTKGYEDGNYVQAAKDYLKLARKDFELHKLEKEYARKGKLLESEEAKTARKDELASRASELWHLGLSITNPDAMLKQAAVLDHIEVVNAYLKLTNRVSKEKFCPKGRATERKQTRYARLGEKLRKFGASDNPKVLRTLLAEIKQNKKQARKADWLASGGKAKGNGMKAAEREAMIREEESFMPLINEAHDLMLFRDNLVNGYAECQERIAARAAASAS